MDYRAAIRSLIAVLTKIACTCIAAVLFACGRAEQPATMNANFDYAGAVRANDCTKSPAADAPGQWNNVVFAERLQVNVRAPANYRNNIRHPLLVVFAAATHDAYDSEAFTGLTPPATARGYVVAYTQSRRLTTSHLSAVNKVVAAVEASWCIEPQQVFFTGHSDGGTTAVAQTFLERLNRRPSAVAASAAGFSAEALDDIECPSPTPALILGLSEDKLFPGYDRALAEWFARCNRCASARTLLDAGCHRFTGCAAPTSHCVAPGGHRKWPPFNAELLDFFDQTRIQAQSP